MTIISKGQRLSWYSLAQIRGGKDRFISTSDVFYTSPMVEPVQYVRQIFHYYSMSFHNTTRPSNMTLHLLSVRNNTKLAPGYVPQATSKVISAWEPQETDQIWWTRRRSAHAITLAALGTPQPYMCNKAPLSLEPSTRLVRRSITKRSRAKLESSVWIVSLHHIKYVR